MPRSVFACALIGFALLTGPARAESAALRGSRAGRPLVLFVSPGYWPPGGYWVGS